MDGTDKSPAFMSGCLLPQIDQLAAIPGTTTKFRPRQRQQRRDLSQSSVTTTEKQRTKMNTWVSHSGAIKAPVAFFPPLRLLSFVSCPHRFSSFDPSSFPLNLSAYSSRLSDDDAGAMIDDKEDALWKPHGKSLFSPFPLSLEIGWN